MIFWSMLAGVITFYCSLGPESLVPNIFFTVKQRNKVSPAALGAPRRARQLRDDGCYYFGSGRSRRCSLWATAVPCAGRLSASVTGVFSDILATVFLKAGSAEMFSASLQTDAPPGEPSALVGAEGSFKGGRFHRRGILRLAPL